MITYRIKPSKSIERYFKGQVWEVSCDVEQGVCDAVEQPGRHVRSQEEILVVHTHEHVDRHAQEQRLVTHYVTYSLINIKKKFVGQMPNCIPFPFQT